ncbi:TPA: winged helix-turn-helix transcriptional regulator [Streptococcus pyogenes]|nr:winged helix-turn-helix transcriptional regulator [Streptococcus pyogenes]HER0892954.1 winged helix-turn-helix transcriptional regulator [Streptococcus pyogenes]
MLRDLLKGTLRFGQLKSSIGSVSQKVLTAQLRAMEAHREVYAEVPPRVEYSLTETGLSLAPVIEAMSDWDQIYQEKHADLFEEG